MSVSGKRIAGSFGKIISNPFKAVELAWRRLFPFGIVPKDAEAYRIGSWSYGNMPRKPIAEVFPGIGDIAVSLHRAFDKDPITSADFGEVLQLAAMAKHVNAKSVLEIGTFDGNTTLNFALNIAPESRVTTVDLPPDWDGTYTHASVGGFYDNVTDRKGVGRQYQQVPEAEKKIDQVFGDSGNLDWTKLPNAPFDLIFIDGNHHKDYVKSDTENALKVLKPGGIICWHDYGMIKDVSDVVDAYNTRFNISILRGTRIAVGLAK